MKIIFKENQDDFIEVSKVNKKEHIVVGTIGGDPVLLSRSLYGKGDFRFNCLSRQASNGNTFRADFKTFSGALKYMEDEKIQAFNNADWKKALQWLIDNG